MSFLDDFKPPSNSSTYNLDDVREGDVHVRTIVGLEYRELGPQRERKSCLVLDPAPHVCAKNIVALSGERHADLKRLFLGLKNPADIAGEKIGIIKGTSEHTSASIRFVAAPKSESTPPSEMLNGPNGDAERETEPQDIPF